MTNGEPKPSVRFEKCLSPGSSFVPYGFLNSLSLCLLAWLWAFQVWAVEVVDDSGRRIGLKNTAERILTLSPHAAELTFAAGAGGRVLGTVRHSDFPNAAKGIPRIGDAAHLDRERILALDPDLVIAWPSGNRAGDLTWLEQQGIPVYHSEPLRLDDIATNLIDIGTLAGTLDNALTSAGRFRTQLNQLARTYAREPAIGVFYQLWPKPLITIGSRHFISEVLRLCGAENVFSGVPGLAPRIGREAVIKADPLAIVAAQSPGDDEDPLAGWRHWKSLRAVSGGNLFTVNADLIHRPTPRLLEGAEHICRQLQGVRDPD